MKILITFLALAIASCGTNLHDSPAMANATNSCHPASVYVSTELDKKDIPNNILLINYKTRSHAVVVYNYREQWFFYDPNTGSGLIPSADALDAAGWVTYMAGIPDKLVAASYYQLPSREPKYANIFKL